jgi:hypothetical protein
VYTASQEQAISLILRRSQRYCLFLPMLNLEPSTPEIEKITIPNLLRFSAQVVLFVLHEKDMHCARC